MQIKLIELTLGEPEDIFNMVKEIGPGEENGFVNSLYNDRFEEFHHTLQRNIEFSKGLGLEPQYVPQTIYWLYINDRPVGYGKLRHRLNEKLLEYGGHIGYTIRPSERNKGYGKLILEELLVKAKELNIDEVLVTCDQNNTSSRKVIEANNGKLADCNNGECRYWIYI